MRRSYVLFCHREAIQLARSRMINGTPSRFKPAATAKPDGPAPTMTGPLTQMQRREKMLLSGMKVWNMLEMLRDFLLLFLCILKQSLGSYFCLVLNNKSK